jgi:FkbM family methyltransferase
MKDTEIKRPSLIVDLGANDGADIPYYLRRADLVVVVEANPDLCKVIEDKFQREVKEGRLVVECVVVTVDGTSAEPTWTEFYVHKKSHGLSQIQRPRTDIAEFECRVLPSIDVAQLIGKYLVNHDLLYCKIDLEHFDKQVVRHLFRRGIRPPYLSAEVHSLKVFSHMVKIGKYNAFKLVKGDKIAEEYSDFEIGGDDGPFTYSFPLHSAGPFGEDVRGEWLTRIELLECLSASGRGWRDVHATNKTEDKFSLHTKKELFRFAVTYLLAWLTLYPRPIIGRFRMRLRSFFRRRLWGVSKA